MNIPEASKPELTLLDVMDQTYILPLEPPHNVVTDFAELDDGTLVELVEDPAEVHTLLSSQPRAKVLLDPAGHPTQLYRHLFELRVGRYTVF